MKYVIGRNAANHYVVSVFDESITHAYVGQSMRRCGATPTSAGFVRLSEDKVWTVGTEASESLKLGPRPEDGCVLRLFLHDGLTSLDLANVMVAAFNRNAEKCFIREFVHNGFTIQEWLIHVPTGDEVTVKTTRQGVETEHVIRKPKPALLWTRCFDTLVIDGWKNPVFWTDSVTADPFTFEACRRRCREAFEAYWGNPQKAES